MKKHTAANLLAYRKKKGITQEELAEQSGVTARTIQRIESGQVVPQPYTLKVLANCLGVSPEELNTLPGVSETVLPEPLHAQTGTLAAMHLIPLIGIYLPLANILAPLIFWLLKKDAYPIFDEQGCKLVNFQLTLSLIAGLAMVTMVLYFPVGYPWLMACYLYAIIMAVLNLVRVLKHRKISYPLSIQFLRPSNVAGN